MAAKVRIEINDRQKILLKRHLNKNGEAQVRFTQECSKFMNNYVPYDTGRLKDAMIEIQTNKIIFHAPYARKQYYTNKGLGKQGENIGGTRGKYWDKRMWQNHGNTVIKNIGNFVGGRVK